MPKRSTYQHAKTLALNLAWKHKKDLARYGYRKAKQYWDRPNGKRTRRAKYTTQSRARPTNALNYIATKPGLKHTMRKKEIYYSTKNPELRKENSNQISVLIENSIAVLKIAQLIK